MDLFQSAALADNQSKLDIAATKLAILFSDEIDIPKQYRKGLKKPSKSKEDTLLMKKFKSNVAHWRDLIGYTGHIVPSIPGILCHCRQL